jgi:preprotein translocase subunit SecF
MIDFVGKKQWFFLISLVVITISIISLAVFKLQPGLDFTGGTSMTINFIPKVEQGEAAQFGAQLRQKMAELGHPEAILQFREKSRDFFVRMKFISPEEVNELRDNIEAAFNRDVEISVPLEVSPAIAERTARNAGIAVIIAAIAMLIYIAWAFRRMPRPFRWGTCAVIALIHDVLIVLGIFSILGQLTGAEVNAMFITGLLTVVGYSINNTVVVFDRVRENISKHISPDFAVTVNCSLTETLARSLNTSLTTLCVILALLLFGGVTIHYFVLVLFIGLLAGTYSSLCIAGPLLVIWEKGEWSKLLPFAKKPAWQQ